MITGVGIKGSDKDIGPWVKPKDAKEIKNKQVLIKASRLWG